LRERFPAHAAVFVHGSLWGGHALRTQGTTAVYLLHAPTLAPPHCEVRLAPDDATLFARLGEVSLPLPSPPTRVGARNCLPSCPSPPSFAHAGTASPPVSPSPTLNPPPAPFLTPLLLALRGPRPGKVGRAIGSRGSLGRAVRAFGEAARLAPADADLQASLLEARRAYSRAQS